MYFMHVCILCTLSKKTRDGIEVLATEEEPC